MTDIAANLRALAEAATPPRPWKVVPRGTRWVTIKDAGDVDVIHAMVWDQADPLPALIVASVNAVPALLDQIDTLTEQREEAWSMYVEAKRGFEDEKAISATLTEQAEGMVTTLRQMSDDNYALRSENTRLTDHLAAAERVVEAGVCRKCGTQKGELVANDPGFERCDGPFHDALSTYDEKARA